MFLRSAVLLRLRFEVPDESLVILLVSPGLASSRVYITCIMYLRRYMRCIRVGGRYKVPVLGNHVSRI